MVPMRRWDIAGYPAGTAVKFGSVASLSLSFVCPDGFRFEGIDLETALWLRRTLR